MLFRFHVCNFLHREIFLIPPRELLKYQDLKNALRETWDLDDACIIPVVVEATGLMKTNLKAYLDRIPGSPSMGEVQLAVLKGTISIVTQPHRTVKPLWKLASIVES